LGYLFGYTSDVNTRTELVILLTPRVVNNQEEAKETTVEYINRLKGVTTHMLEKEVRIHGTKKKTEDNGIKNDKKEQEK
ncbi:MAG TPA: hypothetical protein HPP56_00745, partial [Nitrospirae bacterium]|nr:hypothetical protein [Nitrospirota bacterium]